MALARLNDKISRLKISGGVTSDLGSEFMMYDQARGRYYASRFSLFLSYGVNSAATMPGPGCARSLIRMRGPVYDLWPIGLGRYARHALGIIPGETYRKPQAASHKRSLE